MSTYYCPVCMVCRTSGPFVARSSASGWGAGAGLEELPTFLGLHSEHLEAVEFVSEHDERDNWPEQDAR